MRKVSDANKTAIKDIGFFQPGYLEVDDDGFWTILYDGSGDMIIEGDDEFMIPIVSDLTGYERSVVELFYEKQQHGGSYNLLILTDIIPKYRNVASTKESNMRKVSEDNLTFAEELGLDEASYKELESEVGEIVDGHVYDWKGIDGGLVLFETEDGKEWKGVENEEIAESIAVDMVKENLYDDASMFNSSWLYTHFDTERFIREIRSDIENMAWGDVKDSPEQYGIFKEDAEEENEAFDNAVEDETEDIIKNIESDPIGWLEELSMEDTIVNYINVDEAAIDAVNIDGWQHFLSSYDGNSHELADGFVYWREN